MQWLRHYLRWHSCRRWSHCCSPLNSAQSGGKHGRAYLAGWPKLRPPPHSAAGRRRRRSGGCPSLQLRRHRGTAGPGRSADGRGGGVRPAASASVCFLLQKMSRHPPAWWSDAGWCWRPGWPGGGAAGKMLGPAPASAAETQAAPLSATRTRSYYGRLTRTSADKCAALFPAPVAALWQMHLSADWCARLLKPFSGWMTCTVHRGRPRPLPCPASTGK